VSQDQSESFTRAHSWNQTRGPKEGKKIAGGDPAPWTLLLVQTVFISETISYRMR
jgi:hypothetical protein